MLFDDRLKLYASMTRTLLGPNQALQSALIREYEPDRRAEVTDRNGYQQISRPCREMRAGLKILAGSHCAAARVRPMRALVSPGSIPICPANFQVHAHLIPTR